MAYRMCQLSVDLSIIKRIDKWSDRVDSHTIGMSVLSDQNLIPLDLSVGRLHTCFISDETNYCSGYNAYGQLGDGSQSDRASPKEITYFSRELYSMSLGCEHSCGIDNEGVFCTVGEGITMDKSEQGITITILYTTNLRKYH